jgi:hypothetical protein
MEVAKAWAEELGKRVFYPIRKSAFKTVGAKGGIVQPLDLIIVDGLEYRVTAINRSYSAENNSYTSEYNVEWLGGK